MLNDLKVSDLTKSTSAAGAMREMWVVRFCYSTEQLTKAKTPSPEPPPPSPKVVEIQPPSDLHAPPKEVKMEDLSVSSIFVVYPWDVCLYQCLFLG